MNRRSFPTSILTIALAVFASVTFASAQRLQVPQASQKAGVMQRVGLTDISVTYSRPAVKARTVYGDWPMSAPGEATLDNQNTRPAGAPLVPWGHIWRAGANEATVFAVNDNVLINGQPLAAGRYEIAAIPSKDGDWTLIFNKDADQWGAFNYDAGKDVLRVKTKPQWVTEPQELLTFTIDGVTDDSAIVNLKWDKASVPFTVKVPDVNTKAIAHLRTTVGAAKADDYNTPMGAAGYAKNIKDTNDATMFLDLALKAADNRLAQKEDFSTLRAKALILQAQGKTQDFIAIGQKAVDAGKAEKQDTSALEKRIADAKSGKM